MTESASEQHLRSKYVFVDTESFRRARFDWTGRTLSKLVELANQGHLRLLVTDVTVGEIKSQLREVLAEAATSLKKHESVLHQVGAIDALTKLADQNAAVAALEAAFAKFLKDTKSVNVPVNADISTLLGDYFARRPPFSAKKKSEFPDAITIASLLAWCAKGRATTAYVVSGDTDLMACCSEAGPLFYCASVKEIISQANVSKELHAALQEALQENERLGDELADQIKSVELVCSPGSWSTQRAQVRVSGRIYGVDDINILSVSVLDQDGDIFTCEIELEARLCLDLNVEVGGYQDYGDYKPPSFQTLQTSIHHYFCAEVITKFERKAPENIELESVSVSGNSVELRPEQIDDRWFR